MENKIGEIVTLPPHNIEAKVVEVPNHQCNGCYFNNNALCIKYRDNGLLGECSSNDRKDRKNIIYKPLKEE